MLATDRTLLCFEPMLFQNVSFLPQRLTSGTCSISGTTLTASAADPAFDVAGIASGHVVSIDGVSYEILERLTSTTLTVSRLRTSDGAAAIPPPAISSRPFAIDTFAPQIALAHTQLLHMLNLAPTGSQTSCPNEDALLNPADFAQLEAVLALKLILNAAGTLTRDTPALASFRRSIDSLLEQLQATLTAKIDLNDDGKPDQITRLNIHQLIRN